MITLALNPHKPMVWAYRGLKYSFSSDSHSVSHYLHCTTNQAPDPGTRVRCKSTVGVKHSFTRRKCADHSSAPPSNRFLWFYNRIPRLQIYISDPSLFYPNNTIAYPRPQFLALIFFHSTLDDYNIASPPYSSLIYPVTHPILPQCKVRRGLLSLETSRAYGVDIVLFYILQERASDREPALTCLFSLDLKTGTFPLSW